MSPHRNPPVAADRMPHRRARTWPILAVAAVVLVVLVLSVVYRSVTRAVENAYAVWNVADLIVDHMRANDDQWPRGWSDLADACRARHPTDDVDRMMDHYHERVEVDFSADPRALKAAPFDPATQQRPFDVVRHRHPPHSYYSEPNVIIWSYLNGPEPRLRADLRAAAKPATAPASAPAG